MGKRLHTEYPYIEAEVRYAARREYAATAVDIIARRLRLSFLNVQVAEDVLPRIVEIMAEELGWSKAEGQRQTDQAMAFLRAQMGKDVNKTMRDQTPINLNKKEIKEFVARFNAIDNDRKGFITLMDLRRSLEVKF